MLPRSRDMSCGPINQWLGTRIAPQEPNTEVIVEVRVYDPRTGEMFGKPQQVARVILCWNEELENPAKEVADRIEMIVGLKSSIAAAVKRLVKDQYFGNSLAEHELTALALEMADDCKRSSTICCHNANSREEFLELNEVVKLGTRDWVPIQAIENQTEVQFCLVAEVRDSKLQQDRKAYLKKLAEAKKYKVEP